MIPQPIQTIVHHTMVNLIIHSTQKNLINSEVKISSPIRILIIDDQPFSSIMLHFFLTRVEDIEIVGYAEKPSEVIDLLSELQPDIALLNNIETHEVDDFFLVKTIVKNFPTTKILMISYFNDIDFIKSAFVNGVKGYLLKGALADKIVYGIRRIQEGSSFIDPNLHEVVEEGLNSPAKIYSSSSLFVSPRDHFVQNEPSSRRFNSFLLCKSLSKPYWTLLLSALFLIVILSGMVILQRSLSKQKITSIEVQKTPTRVVALGRLEPQGGVIHVAAPGSVGNNNGGSRVAELKVQEGDRIYKGQLVAVLDSRDRLIANLREAKQQVTLARAKLSQILAGAKQSEINARKSAVASLRQELAGEISSQRAEVERLKAEFLNAQNDALRFSKLFHLGAVSESEVARYRLDAKTAKERFMGASANLNKTQNILRARIQESQYIAEQVMEVRPTDIAFANAEIEDSISKMKSAETNLMQAYIHAPLNGTVLRIHTHSGERVGDKGILEVGQTDTMIVVAEVYESDINKVHIGQSAIINSPTNAFSERLIGKIMEIGNLVAKQDVLGIDPTATKDARVVEVKIQLHPSSSRKVSRLTNTQVSVEISL
jgi:HlyD family secretion protein